MRILFFKRGRGRPDPDRTSFAFFVAGAVAVLAAVFVIGLLAGRYIERNRADGDVPSREAPPGRDNGAAIGKELGAFADEPSRVASVPPLPADNGASLEKTLTFPETLGKKEPEVIPLSPPVPAVKRSPGTAALSPAPKEAGGAGKPRYGVQAGSFREKAGAKTFRDRLAKAGFPVSVSPSKGKNGAFWRVLAGPYDSKEKAREAARRMKAVVGDGAIVVRM